jgi:preprotein translocase subunit SecY
MVVSVMMMAVLLLLTAIAVVVVVVVVNAEETQRRRAPYTEAERQEEYIKRNHTFPFPQYTPNTEGTTS